MSQGKVAQSLTFIPLVEKKTKYAGKRRGAKKKNATSLYKQQLNETCTEIFYSKT